jgi:hypothetical protein
MKILDRLLDKHKKSEAITAYNLGLAAKYKGDWKESYAQNQRANALRPGDEATIWNLGIAATALNDWEEARRLWRTYGIEVNDGPGEVLTSEVKACVRLNPSISGEVVWGVRLDPARIRVLNVPLASSDRLYGDILINDGAPEGTRISDGDEYPVFDELGIWRRSAHSTFEVELIVPNATAFEILEDRCRQNDMWVEDWGTVRMLCEACSRGNPGEHVCTAESVGQNKFGFAAKSESDLRRLLDGWVEMEDGAALKSLRLVVNGVSE